MTERPEDTVRRYARILVRLGDLHKPLHIYDECSHEHTSEQVEAGEAIDCRDFIACGDAYLYPICTACCTDADLNQTEACVSSHPHGRDLSCCPTRAILDDTEGDDE